MLTNLFYYGHYKPYVLQEYSSAGSAVSAKKPRITDKGSAELLKSRSFMLNKSLKAEVVRYARNISTTIMQVKDTARDLVQTMEEFNKTTRDDGLDEAKRDLENAAVEFVNAYNNAGQFINSQSQSQELRDYYQELRYNVIMSGDSLTQLGISADEDGRLTLQKDAIRRRDAYEMNIAIGKNIQLFSHMYTRSMMALGTPMVEHMNFKGFNYHYNYKLGSVITDSFNMIESGMIVDQVV